MFTQKSGKKDLSGYNITIPNKRPAVSLNGALNFVVVITLTGIFVVSLTQCGNKINDNEAKKKQEAFNKSLADCNAKNHPDTLYTHTGTPETGGKCVGTYIGQPPVVKKDTLINVTPGTGGVPSLEELRRIAELEHILKINLKLPSRNQTEFGSTDLAIFAFEIGEARSNDKVNVVSIDTMDIRQGNIGLINTLLDTEIADVIKDQFGNVYPGKKSGGSKAGDLYTGFGGIKNDRENKTRKFFTRARM